MKKFGKFLLFGAAVGTAAAAAYHYLKKTENATDNASTEDEENSFVSEDEPSYFDDEDFDDEIEIKAFEDEDLDEDAAVSVEECVQDPTPDTDIEDMATATPEPSFSPLAETLMQEEDVEEFFDEEDEDTTEE